MASRSDQDDLAMLKQSPVIWRKATKDTQLEKFKTFIEGKYNLQFASYWDFHKWTVNHFECYWEEVWNWFGMKSSKKYEKIHIKTGPGFLDNKWFSGARFNQAENVLRCRDDTEAILYMDEEGHEEHVTFGDLYHEVQLYAAAMRQAGIKKGDMVCVQMNNRKEAIFIKLAAVSVGALFSGPQAYLGPKASAKIVARIQPKIVFVVDRHLEENLEYNVLANVPAMIESCSSIENIVIIPSQEKSLSRDISQIPNSCFLPQFLKRGRTPDGKVPDLVFEQLPFDHPAFVSFTSGTTSIPKASVHSAGAFISLLADYAFSWDLKKGDTLFNLNAPGWIVWYYNIFCLQLGVRLFLYSGALSTPERNFWDIIDKNNVTVLSSVPLILDLIIKNKILPSSRPACKNLKKFLLVGCPLKFSHVQFIQENVNENIMVGNMYAATEAAAVFSGFDHNLPVHGTEIQVPKLGLDLRVVNDKGEPIVDKRGDVVIATPCPFFTHQLYKDEGGEIIKRTYLDTHPGCWFQNDAGIINQVTKGILVLGRKDNVHLSGGERFYPDDIYEALSGVQEVEDSICVSQCRRDGVSRTLLFVRMAQGFNLTPDTRKVIEDRIEDEFYIDFIPSLIYQVGEIPYSLNRKKLESVVREIVNTNMIPQSANIRNPNCLKHFCNIPEVMSFVN